MKLIKHFDFVSMTKLDDKDWNVAVGEKWQNNEVQQYVNDEQHIFFEDGLHLRATNENGIIKSGRINTKNKFFFKYGKIDIIAKVPCGLGTWPALWFMPQYSKFGPWPKSGEIDMMEYNAHNKNKFYACLHTEKYNHKNGDPYDTRHIIDGLEDDFQKFGLEWTKDYIKYLVNDTEVVTYYKGADGRDDDIEAWPFDEEFYLIMNLAIGGMFGGDVDMTNFPQDFIIKDVKIYQ